MNDNNDHDEEYEEYDVYQGTVKWFDTKKNFGFVTCDEVDTDILLHGNVLQTYGQNSVSAGAQLDFDYEETDRGLKVSFIENISPPKFNEEELEEMDADYPVYEGDLSELEALPARIKWYDAAKGFGFANIFGKPEDIFVHAAILRRSVFAEVEAGEAVIIRTTESERGKTAVSIEPWDSVCK